MSDLTITGTHSTDTTDGSPVTPFAGVTVSDPVDGAIDTLKLSYYGSGQFSGIAYSGSTISDSNGGYRLIGTAAQVTSALDAITFTPSPPQAGRTTVDTIDFYVQSSAGGYASDSNTVVYDSTPPDTVTFSPQVTFDRGVFTLSGIVTTALGVTDVDIQAIVDGSPTDLGRVRVNADGSFTFKDRVGPHTQGFITAITENTANSANYSSARTIAPFTLTGGLNEDGVVAEQDGYTPDGSAVAFVSHFQPNGVHTTDVSAPGQTLSADYTDTFNENYQGNNTFVYNSGHGSNLVTEFLLRSAQHDTLSFSSADFNNSIASVLAHSYGPGDGTGVIIVDPVTQDTVQLAGISKRSLIEHRGDISFHA